MSTSKKVVVFGGSGFLGSHLADELEREGCEVVIFDRNTSPWLSPRQRMIIGDIMDYGQVLAATEGADYIYHLAGVADIGESARSPRETLEKNILGSLNIIQAGIASGIKRFLLASTVYVYSNKGSFYRISKQAVESLIETFHEQTGLEFTILRYGSLYGPRAQVWNGLKRFVDQGLKKGEIVYPGTGSERREYIHVSDAARMSVKALSPEFANECLTLTGTQILTTRDVLEMIREISGKNIRLHFTPEGDTYQQSHYALTPYRYTPRRGKKIIPSTFIDIGQGILDMIEEIDRED